MMFRLPLALCLVLLCQACGLSSRPPQPAAPLGRPSTMAQMEALLDQPGPLQVRTIASADWQVPLSGLINLHADEAKKAGLQDRPEPIQIYAHVVVHPSQGAYLVDTGVSRQVVSHPGQYGVNWLIRQFMPLDKVKITQSTQDIVRQLPGKLQGVFLTHLHLDHIVGLPDIDASVPVYVGRGESSTRTVTNAVVQGATDGLLGDKRPIREWADQVVDVFGDGSLFALHMPGHTPGSTAYVARTSQGPVLLVGDTCHTAWGWAHGVEPGSFTDDQALNRQSLQALKALAQRHPAMPIRLGHQPGPG